MNFGRKENIILIAVIIVMDCIDGNYLRSTGIGKINRILISLTLAGLGMNRACSVLGLLGDPELRPSIEIDARGILKVARNTQTCVICLI